MNRRVSVATAVMLVVCGCSGNPEPTHREPPVEAKPSSVHFQTPDQVVDSFVAAMIALADDYPELAGFRDRHRWLQGPLEVRFSRRENVIKEMRGVQSRDLQPQGIDLSFLVREENNPVWCQSRQDALIHLKHLHMDLYSNYVLSDQATPGLEEKLSAIFAKHRNLLKDLDEMCIERLSENDGFHRITLESLEDRKK